MNKYDNGLTSTEHHFSAAHETNNSGNNGNGLRMGDIYAFASLAWTRMIKAKKYGTSIFFSSY